MLSLGRLLDSSQSIGTSGYLRLQVWRKMEKYLCTLTIIFYKGTKIIQYGNKNLFHMWGAEYEKPVRTEHVHSHVK
jgi:hypothetical protein